MSIRRVRRRRAAATLIAAAMTSGCAGAGWQLGGGILAGPRAVAAALGDLRPNARIPLDELPRMDPPHHPRMCCAFGMDLEVDFAGLEIPFFQLGNVVGVAELGPHAYELPTGALDGEGNGLLYTCRGGWIDTAHVRELADNVLFLAMHMASRLGTGTTIEIPGHGGLTTIRVAPIPDAEIARDGALVIAAALAAWTAYRISIWHEVSSWYGNEMVAGFSERPSAFSLEDLYSNALGVRLGIAILEERGFASDTQYDLTIEAFLRAALERLEVQSRETSRSIMTSLDGTWWDSSRRLPDNLLVRRRAFPGEMDRVLPWRAEAAFDHAHLPVVLRAACGGAATRWLVVPTEVGRHAVRDLVRITWIPEAWAQESLPRGASGEREVDERQLEVLVDAVHEALALALGPGFDQPGPLAGGSD